MAWIHWKFPRMEETSFREAFLPPTADPNALQNADQGTNKITTEAGNGSELASLPSMESLHWIKTSAFLFLDFETHSRILRTAVTLKTTIRRLVPEAAHGIMHLTRALF